ncbi:MAG: hypothetical protein JWO89_3243, partial [Verrucomicrobiaceae bacterium]|nr:hypothetical protein [Verrucomicrobiaceae bacterium]
MTSRKLLFLSSFLFALAAYTSVLQAQTAPVQVVGGGETIVYQLQFDPPKDSVNYSPYENGYYVAPVQGGSGTLIVTKTTGGTRVYYAFTDFGELFVGRNNGDRKAVISCTAGSDVSTTAFFAVGDATTNFQTDTGEISGTAFYAPELRGYTLSADSQNDELFQGSSSSDFGVAGSGTFSAFYDDADTNNARVNHLSVASVVQLLKNRLTGQNYIDGSNITGGNGSGTGSGSGSSTTATDKFDLVVYRLSFKKTGESLNYKPFSGGYFVVGAVNGTGALILEMERDGLKLYKEYLNFGSVFVAKAQGERKAVLSAMDTNSVSSTTFFAVGDANQSFKVNAPSITGSVNFSKKLTGYAISADSESDLAFFGDGGDIGVAGVSLFTATYLEEATKRANKNQSTVAKEVDQIEKELEEKGFVSIAAG